MNTPLWQPWPAPAARAATTHPSPRHALREVALVALVTLAYFFTRGLVRGRESAARQHADQLLAIERALHLSPEAPAQHLALAHPWLAQAANLFYLGAHLPVLITVAVWLYWTRPWAYRWFRNAFLLSALLGLSVYVVLPVAPPRYLPGFVDTLKAAGFNMDGSSVGLFYNPYAAMPSLHVGWALIAGVAVAVSARARWLRAAGIALAPLMALAVLITGNHYLLDILAGASLAVLALICSARWSEWRVARAASARGVVTEHEPVVLGVPLAD